MQKIPRPRALLNPFDEPEPNTLELTFNFLLTTYRVRFTMWPCRDALFTMFG